MPPVVRDSSSAPTSSVTAEAEDIYEQHQEPKSVDTSRRGLEKESSSFNFSTDDERKPSSSSNINFSGREESGLVGGGSERERPDVRNAFRGFTSQKTPVSAGYSQSSTDIEEKVQKVSPPRQKAYRDERLEKQGLGPRKDTDYLEMAPSNYKKQNVNNSSAPSNGAKQYEPETPPDRSINEILEVGLFLNSFISNKLRSFVSEVLVSGHLFKILVYVGGRGPHCSSQKGD